MDAGIEFVAVDNPHANKLMIHILAAVAQNEREMIAARTKAALAAAKVRGVKLGAYGSQTLAPANRSAALKAAHDLAPILSDLEARGPSARAMAQELNARRIPPVRGKVWYATTILRVRQRLRASPGLGTPTQATRTQLT